MCFTCDEYGIRHARGIYVRQILRVPCALYPPPAQLATAPVGEIVHHNGWTRSNICIQDVSHIYYNWNKCKTLTRSLTCDMSRANNNASLIQEYRFNEYLSLMTDKNRMQHHASIVYDIFLSIATACCPWSSDWNTCVWQKTTVICEVSNFRLWC